MRTNQPSLDKPSNLIRGVATRTKTTTQNAVPKVAPIKSQENSLERPANKNKSNIKKQIIKCGPIKQIRVVSLISELLYS